MIAETISRWIVKKENISKEMFFWFKVWDLNILDVLYHTRNPNQWPFFPVITHLSYTCLSSWALVIFLPFFLINVFQNKSLLLREGLKKILYSDNTLHLYVGLLLAPAEGFGQGFGQGKKKRFFFFLCLF